jgi:hypothetical protein
MTSFRAHLSANVTNFNPNTYNRIPWDVVDEGDADEGWMPVPIGGDPKRVIFTGQLWILPPVTETEPNYVARISKNGHFNNCIGTGIATRAAYKRNYGTVEAPIFTPTYVCSLSMQATAQPGDVFGVWLYTKEATATVDPNQLHSFWAGTTV